MSTAAKSPTAKEVDDTLRLSIVRLRCPVEIAGADNVVAKYVLKELMGDDRDTYLTDLSSRMRVVDGVSSGVKNFKGLDSFAVSLGLFDSQDARVPIETIQSWPARVVTALHKKLKAMSALEDEDKKKDKEEDAKNDS